MSSVKPKYFLVAVVLHLIWIQLICWNSQASAKIIWSPVANDNKIGNSAKTQERPRLEFDENDKFRIVNFADLHYGEAPDTDWGPASDIKSTKVMRDILEWEQPNLVVFTGDQITGELMFPNASAYVEILLRPVIEGGYRWASIYGNHDIGPNVTREEILETEQQYETSYTQHGGPGLPGVTNYYLPIYGRNSEPDSRPAAILWFFDSRGGKDAGGELPHNVDEKVVQWFTDESKKINETWGSIPALAFFHIPTEEFGPVQESISTNPSCTGLVDDDVTPQDRNTGLLNSLESAGVVKTAFVGHDHGNAWCCNYKTLQICYNRHTGYGGYGVWTRGARVIELDYHNPWGNNINYIRLENGSIIDAFPSQNIIQNNGLN